jgi:hypothetical protein
MLEKHRLPAAAPSDDNEDLAGGDLEIEPAQDLLLSERPPHSDDLDHGRTDPMK